MKIDELAGLSVMTLSAEGSVVSSEQDALDLIGQTWGSGVDMVIVPICLMAPEFFRLETGLAGQIAQKFINYGLKVAFVGEIGVEHVSKPWRDYVFETNKSGQVLFARDEAELGNLLG